MGRAPVPSPRLNNCFASSASSDGIGHQMEGRLSCIGLAEMLFGISYMHKKMIQADHGINATLVAEIENYFGLSNSFGTVSKNYTR